MKTKIKLTEEQINVLIESKAKEISDNYEKEIERLTKEHQKNLSDLRKRFENYELEIPEDVKPDTKKRIKFDVDELKKLVKEGLTTSEIAKKLNKSVPTVFAKIKKLGLETKKKK